MYSVNIGVQGWSYAAAPRPRGVAWPGLLGFDVERPRMSHVVVRHGLEVPYRL